MTRNWKTSLTLAFTGKIYFRILGLGLGSVSLALYVSGLGLLALALLTSLAYDPKFKGNAIRSTTTNIIHPRQLHLVLHAVLTSL